MYQRKEFSIRFMSKQEFADYYNISTNTLRRYLIQYDIGRHDKYRKFLYQKEVQKLVDILDIP